MGKKRIFPRIEIGPNAFNEAAVKENQGVLALRKSRQLKRFVGNLGRFKTLPFLPSFLIRTLNDSLHVAPQKLSSMQRTFAASWARAGLGKRHALEHMEKFHETSKDALPLLDKRYFEAPADKLDGMLMENIRRADWKAYMNAKPVSPIHLAAALNAGTTNGLSTAEKLFLTSTSGLKPTEDQAALKECQFRGLGNYVGVPSKPFPDLRLQVYTFTGKITKWRLLVSSDHLGGNADPVFIVRTLYNSGAKGGGIKRAGSRVLHPGDDVSASENWTTYDDWAALWAIPASMPYVGALCGDFVPPAPDIVDTPMTTCVGANPTVIVNAFEDDEWFSEDTKNIVDFATDVAVQITSLAGGVASIVANALDLGWDLICYLDSLDENDPFTPVWWTLPENQITNQPITDFPWTFDLYEIGGTNHWQIQTTLTVTDPYFL